MARALEQAGVIRYAWQFWLARALDPSAKLQAGEYRFDRPGQRLRRLRPHRARRHLLSSNSTSRKAATCSTSRAWSQAAGVMTAQDFLKAAQDPALDPRPGSRTRPRSKATCSRPPIGCRIPPPRREFCKMMTTQFRRQWKKLPRDESRRRPASRGDAGIAGGEGNRACRRSVR